MTEDLMAYLEEHPEYFYLARDKQAVSIMRFLSEGGKSFDDLTDEFNLQKSKLKTILDDLKKKKVLTTMMTGAGELYILDFNGQKILDLLEKAKEEA